MRRGNFSVMLQSRGGHFISMLHHHAALHPELEIFQCHPQTTAHQWPLGFPNLSGYWAGKVLSANQIYLQLCAFCVFLNTLKLTWSIENPANSYMWSIRDYKQLSRDAIFVVFDSSLSLSN